MSFSFLASLFLSILLLALTKLNFTSPLTAFLNRLGQPVLIPITFIRSEKNNLASNLRKIPRLSEENSKLKNENNLLKIRAKKLADLVTDQKQLATLEKHSWQSQPVKLVSLGSLATFTSLDFANIRPGQPVAIGNSLVGLVKSVEPPVIRVSLLTNPETKLPVQLETGAKGDLIFRNNQTLVTNLDNNTVFNAKTTVFTLPGLLIPENLIIGQIEKVISNPASPTQEATLSLDQEASNGHNFFIITKP